MPFDASVRAYLRAYQNEYRAALHGGQHTAELSFRVPMHEMFRRIAHDLNPAGTFDIILEPRNQGRMGRPDWRIQDRISLGVYGYIEAKGPSNEPFDTTPYRDQINRYLTLGHKLIITDGIDFVFCFTETPVVVSIIDKARMDALDWSRLPVDPLFRFYMEQFFSNPAPQRVDEEKLVELVAIRTRNLADEIREYSDLTIEEAMNEDEHHSRSASRSPYDEENEQLIVRDEVTGNSIRIYCPVSLQKFTIAGYNVIKDCWLKFHSYRFTHCDFTRDDLKELLDLFNKIASQMGIVSEIDEIMHSIVGGEVALLNYND